ncbi:hypothetical protein [Commensalibacter sp. A3DC]|uniref:hypothetical protein n=1 Tax=Commensalibacter sp. A3DC TaxID=3093920 RepID=UPI0039B47C94
MENRKGLNQRYKGVDRQWEMNRNSGTFNCGGQSFDAATPHNAHSFESKSDDKSNS